ncbi:MAG: hypothetical protein ACYDH2_05440 [Anaerolineaceae bacterium]
MKIALYAILSYLGYYPWQSVFQETLSKVADHLPALIVITWPAEIIALIFISSPCPCTEDHFRILQPEEAGISLWRIYKPPRKVLVA